MAPSIESIALSRARSHFSYRQYAPTPSLADDALAPASQSSTSSPETAPIVGVGEIRDQMAHRIRGEPLPCVGEHDRIVACSGDARVERRGFAVRTSLDEPYRRSRS